jgi:ribosomal protein S27AE
VTKACVGKLGYIAWHTEADRRHKLGQRQKRCPGCGLYVFMQWRREVRWHDGQCARRRG